MTRRDKRRLEDILRAIDSILEHRPASKEELRNDEPLRSHLKLKLQIVGEAAANLDSEVRGKAPNIPWRAIIGMRTILARDDESGDLDLLWDVVKSELPALRSNVEELRTRGEGENQTVRGEPRTSP